jgi:DNA-binding MurR/RpiR family transcriptional regulator
MKATAVRTAHDELTQRIRARLDGLSDGQRRVADYILAHYDQAAFLTAARLGQRVGVSESTVVRFASVLGYRGYPGLQGVLQEMIRSRLAPDGRARPSSGAASADEVLTAIMQADAENIRLTLRDVDRRAFRTAVALLLGARRILVVGFRGATSLALFMGFNLDWILGNVKVVGHAGQDLWESLVHLGRDDVVVGIGFPRHTRSTIQALAAARARGCRVVALTDGVVSPLTRHADVLLTARGTVPALTDSYVAPLSLINALLAATSAADRTRATRTRRKLEELQTQYGVYFSV